MDNFERKKDAIDRILMVPNDPIAILSNQKFENILHNTQLIRNTVFLDLQMQSLDEFQRVLELIKDELK